MAIREPTTTQLTVLEDSRRWASIELRDDDIVIATPPKSGTTWTQGIVASLLWPGGDAPLTEVPRSPWIDMRLELIEDVVANVGAQQHRRYLKTHSPSTSIPIGDDVKYLAVYRHIPDALVSWGNHRATMRPDITKVLNEMARVDGLDPMAETFDGDYESLLEEYLAFWSPVDHLRSWWPLRDRANVLLLHYADLLADLEREMRRIATFLEIDVAETQWPDVVARCRLAPMREAARAEGRVDIIIDGGADSFFHKGENGRGERMLSAALIERCLQHATDGLSEEAADWLARGSALIRQ